MIHTFRNWVLSVIKLMAPSKADSLLEARVDNLILSAAKILLRPFLKAFRHREWRKTSDIVEKKYDLMSGSYIDATCHGTEHKEHLGYVGGRIKQSSSIGKNKRLIAEYTRIFSRFHFQTVLEVGAGELTTMIPLADSFGSDIEWHGMDLSLNRVYHGKRAFLEKGERRVHVCKANAVALPYPDGYFDLVYTSHCLEHMPYDFRKAIDEMCRVTKEWVVLFEPSYELGSFSQKIRMVAQDYVKNIPRYIRSLKDVALTDHFLLKNGALFNRGACHVLRVKKPPEVRKAIPEFHHVCPRCRSQLRKHEGYLECERCHHVYFIFKGIPVLDKKYALYITHEYKSPA